jgi:RNA polymerase sigma factor (sigma-70 family)
LKKYPLPCNVFYFRLSYYRMEQEKFKKEVVPLRGKLEACARRLLDDPQDVEDAVQETFLKLWFIRDELDQYDSVEALAVQITKHLCINKLRAFKIHNEEPICDNEFKMESNDTPYSILERKDSVHQLMQIVDGLPKLQQTILKMKHVEGFEVSEIAALTGSTADAIRVSLSRARKKIKDEFLKIQ